jgi:hypothetical protein
MSIYQSTASIIFLPEKGIYQKPRITEESDPFISAQHNAFSADSFEKQLEELFSDSELGEMDEVDALLETTKNPDNAEDTLPTVDSDSNPFAVCTSSPVPVLTPETIILPEVQEILHREATPAGSEIESEPSPTPPSHAATSSSSSSINKPSVVPKAKKHQPSRTSEYQKEQRKIYQEEATRLGMDESEYRAYIQDGATQRKSTSQKFRIHLQRLIRQAETKRKPNQTIRQFVDEQLKAKSPG